MNNNKRAPFTMATKMEEKEPLKLMPETEEVLIIVGIASLAIVLLTNYMQSCII